MVIKGNQELDVHVVLRLLLSFPTIQTLKIPVECLQELTSSCKLYWCYSITKKNVYPLCQVCKVAQVLIRKVTNYA